MTVETFAYEGPELRTCTNDKWLVAIKNWRKANDVENISRLEVHFKTDEQFILLAGSAVLIYAENLDGRSAIHVKKLEAGKVFQVPRDFGLTMFFPGTPSWSISRTRIQRPRRTTAFIGI